MALEQITFSARPLPCLRVRVRMAGREDLPGGCVASVVVKMVGFGVDNRCSQLTLRKSSDLCRACVSC